MVYIFGGAASVAFDSLYNIGTGIANILTSLRRGRGNSNDVNTTSRPSIIYSLGRRSYLAETSVFHSTGSCATPNGIQLRILF